MKDFFKRFWPALSLISIAALGAVLRLIPLMQRDFWYDEAFTGITVRQSWGNMMDIIVHDVHPPFYYWMLKLWTMIVGSGPEALRLFSVMFGVGTIILVFVALKQWHKKSVVPALVGAFVIAIDPFFVNYSQEARMYALLAFLITLAAILLTKAWETKSWKIRIAYSIVLLCVMLTHYLGVIFAIGFFIADAIQHRKSHPKNSKLTLHNSLSGYLIPFLGGLAWLPFFKMQAGMHGALGWIPSATLDHIPVSLHIFLLGSPVGVNGVPPALGYRFDWITVPSVSILLVMLLAALVTWITIKKKWDAHLLFAGFMMAFPLLVTFALQVTQEKLFVERYLTGCALFLVLFLVLALSRFGKERNLLIALGGYVVMVCLIQPWSYTQVLQGVSNAIAAQPNQHEVITSNAYDFTMYRYYLGEQANVRLYNVSNVNEDFSGWAIIPKSNILSTLPKSDNVIVTEQPELFTEYQPVTKVNGYSILKPM